MTGSIKKAVILAAGRGSRMMPLTKCIPKPMLPLYDKPALAYIVEEVFSSGIEEIEMVVGHKKEVIKSYFGDDPRISFVTQKVFGGTADALLYAKPFVKKEAFALLYADEVILNDIPCIFDLIKLYDLYHTPILSLDKTTAQEIVMYNSVFAKATDRCHVYDISDIIEKPQNSYPSFYTAIGRMILTPDIFNYIGQLTDSSPVGEELVLTKALSLWMKNVSFKGLRLDGKRLDLGNKESWMQAHIEMYQIQKAKG